MPCLYSIVLSLLFVCKATTKLQFHHKFGFISLLSIFFFCWVIYKPTPRKNENTLSSTPNNNPNLACFKLACNKAFLSYKAPFYKAYAYFLFFKIRIPITLHLKIRCWKLTNSHPKQVVLPPSCIVNYRSNNVYHLDQKM